MKEIRLFEMPVAVHQLTTTNILEDSNLMKVNVKYSRYRPKSALGDPVG
jgi:hypothetical protein